MSNTIFKNHDNITEYERFPSEKFKGLKGLKKTIRRAVVPVPCFTLRPCTWSSSSF